MILETIPGGGGVRGGGNADGSLEIGRLGVLRHYVLGSLPAPDSRQHVVPDRFPGLPTVN